MEDLLLFIGGLPVHPLAVHFAVVLFPLAALLLALVVSWPRLRNQFLGMSVIFLALTVPLVFIAQQSGEALGDYSYEPDPHSTFGDLMTPVALATAGVGVVFWIAHKVSWPKLILNALGFLVVSAAVGATAMTFVVGHSGAEAVWG